MKNNDYHNLLMNSLPNSYSEWFKADRNYLLRTIEKNSLILDVACGDGRSIFDLIPVTTNIIGIDHDQYAVKNAKNNFKDIDSIEIIDADAKNIPFEEKKFDYVVCMGSFMNFAQDKFIILSEMKRVLKEDGLIILSTFSENALGERLKIYKKVKAPINKVVGGIVYFDESLGDSISEQFSNDEMKEIFATVNLNIVEMNEVGIGCIWKLSK